MKHLTMTKLLAAQLKIQDAQKRQNERVRKASNGRSHHQACPIGGLSTGMGADISGADCWCGATLFLRETRAAAEVQS